MIEFAIPLRAKETSSNWNMCVARLNQTIRSIFNQTCDEFKCLIACNEAPQLDREYDERLEFIPLELSIPNGWLEMSRDKFWKLTVIAVRIRQLLEQQKNPDEGIYVMPVDADDLLNCNIAEYCKEHPKENGLVSDSGYVWQVGKRFLRKYPQMYEYCGSCNIIKMYRDDLPDKCPAPASLCHDKETAAVLNLRYPIRYDHNTVVRRYAEEEKPFSTLPFCSTVYVLGTGDNISAIFHNENSERDKRFHPIAFLRNINPFQMQYISRKIKKEFCIE